MTVIIKLIQMDIYPSYQIGFYSVAQMQSWRDPIRYYYYLINGKLVDDGWKIINNEWYYFSNGAAYCWRKL